MKNWKEELPRLWEKYKYFLIVILAGVLLLLLSQTGVPAANEDQTVEESFDLQAFQQSVAQSLSKVEGAGRVEVLLTLEAGEESVYASDVSESSQYNDESTNSKSHDSKLSIVSDGSYGEAPVLVKSKYPTFRGAVIVCDGADNDTVRLALTDAVSALCGISSDHIYISKMSQ